MWLAAAQCYLPRYENGCTRLPVESARLLILSLFHLCCLTECFLQDGRFHGGAPRPDSVVLPSTGISNRRRPEPSSGFSTRPSTEYIRGSSATMDMNAQTSESGVPAIMSRQRSQSYTSPLQGHPSTSPVLSPPQNSYHTSHQGAPGTHARPEGLASALTDPSPFPASAPPVTRRGSFVSHQRTPSNTHPHLHSPPFALPRHVGSPGRENTHHLAYMSPSMLTTLRPYAPVYRYPIPPDHVSNPSHRFPPSASAPTSPIYPPPPLHSPSFSRRGSSSSTHRPTPYATHGAYLPLGYTTPPSYAYPSPTSFVPIYGSHSPPPHYPGLYGFPSVQESQGMLWYSPPGATAASNSFEGTQRELQPWTVAGHPPARQLEGEQPGQRNTVPLPSELQPTQRQTNQIRIGRPLSDAEQETTQAPFPATSPPNSPSTTTEILPLNKDKHQERRSYHPNPPAHRSDWVMWAGNVPSDVTHDELREFFNQPLPPLSPKRTELPNDRHGGVSTVFIIARSNCAFVNFESEAQLEAATARFNGQPIRPDDQRCPRLVCRVRRREDDLMAGVGAQRGSAMHITWVKEQKARVQREQADTAGSPKAIVRPSLPLSVPSDDRTGEAVSTYSNPSRSGSVSIASTNSDILTRYFPRRYFILKSLTQHDLDLSVQNNVWTTQRHNQEILDQACRSSKDVFLIFSVNKSGEFYGYARMAGLQSEIGVSWASATGSTAPHSSGSSSSATSAAACVSLDDTGGQPSSAAKPRKQLYDRLCNSMPTSSTNLPRTVVPLQTSYSEPSYDTLFHALENLHARDLDDRSKPLSEVPFEGRNTTDDDTEPALGRPLRIEWIRTNTLPFFRTRHLRNPWNHGREVKVSRDGTELEPTVGQKLLDEWDRPSAAVDNTSGPSRTTERRRGSKSSQHTT